MYTILLSIRRFPFFCSRTFDVIERMCRRFARANVLDIDADAIRIRFNPIARYIPFYLSFMIHDSVYLANLPRRST